MKDYWETIWQAQKPITRKNFIYTANFALNVPIIMRRPANSPKEWYIVSIWTESGWHPTSPIPVDEFITLIY